MKKYITSIFLLLIGFTLSAQQTALEQFFDVTDAFLKKYVIKGAVNYEAVSQDADLWQLTDLMAEMDLKDKDETVQKAFYINAYNLLVIKEVADNYPVSSTKDIANFFDAKKYIVAQEKLSLNQLEKINLLAKYGDTRLHFVLVCGAKGCPPLTDFAYRPNTLDKQLNDQAAAALNSSFFIRVNNAIEQVGLSRIFEWYASDFGGSRKKSLAFVNGYRTKTIPEDYKITFYPYDWSLNEYKEITTAINNTNQARYIVSCTRPKGTTETKVFNNLYSQRIGVTRTSYFTSFIGFLYGFSDRVNAGFDLRYRRANAADNVGLLYAFTKNENSQAGFATIGPKLRFAPVTKWSNFSIQSAIWLPIKNDLEGNISGRTFLDWNNPSFVTQFFNDFPIGSEFSLFTEFGIYWEDIGTAAGSNNQLSNPTTAIFSYFPIEKMTVYGMASYAPIWGREYYYYYQYGVGAKYQFTPNFEVELLWTNFSNKGLAKANGTAGTYNIGMRYTGN